MELSLVLVVDVVVVVVVVVEVVTLVVGLLVDTLEGLGVVGDVDVDELLLELPVTADIIKRPSTSVLHSIAPPPRCLRC